MSTTSEPGFIGLYVNLSSVFQSLVQDPEAFLKAMAGSPLEWIALVATLACVVLAMYQNIWSWPIGIVGVVLYGMLFYDVSLYSDVLLQWGFFFPSGFLGWWAWVQIAKSQGAGTSFWPVFWQTHWHGLTGKRLEVDDPEVLLTNYGPVAQLVTLVAIVGLTLLLAPVMASAGAALPHWDTFVAVASVFAQLLLVRKVVFSWFLWILVDIIAIGVYSTKELYPTAGLYMLFLGIAIASFINWLRLYRSQQAK